MKILVLMPLDEKWVYIANGIWTRLPNETRDKTFCMPMFMQYTITTKVAENWVYAVFDALVASKHVYEAAEEKEDDLIIIGNAPADLEFDAIFNFQDPDEAVPYEDKFLEKIKLLVKEDKDLSTWLELHKAEESRLSLQNFTATADFLHDYLQTDPHLESIKRAYANKLKNGKYN